MKMKFKLTNRILSLVLAVVMVVGLLPMSSLTAFAAETPVETGYCNNTGEEASRIAIWELSTDGTLTIKKSPSGGTDTGTFSSLAENRPSWETYKAQIKKVVIEDDITSLGSYAFYNYTALEEVVIGDGIQTIKALGFYGCTALTKVTIGSSVRKIESSAFNGCTSLADVTLPNGITTICTYAFANCPMTEITIPASVTTIENLVFDKTQLTKVTYLGTTDPGANSLSVFPYINKAYPTIYVPADYIGTTFCKCTVTKAEATTDINAIVVSATPAEGGSVAVTVNGEPADKAKKDTVVTITVTENAGYVLKSLVAADADDGNIELTKDDNDDNKYTFTMPEKAVSVTAVFKEDSSLVYVGKTVLGIGTYYKCANNTLTSDGTADDYNAYLTFNEATGYTLNIKNLTVSGVQNTNYGAGIYSANDDIALTINFSGTNIINGAENETNAAIYSLGDLNITGSGTLTAKGSTASSGNIKQSSGIAVVDGKSISITNANEVYANAGYANYSPSLSQGLRASNILIENSIVYAKGGQSIGQSGYSEGIEVVRGTLRIKGDGTKVEAISGDEGYNKNGISGNGGSNTLYLESGLLRVESKNATEYSFGITGITLNMSGGIFEAVCGTATSATPIANPPTIAEELSIYDSKNNIIDYTNDYTIFKKYSFVRIAPSHIHEYSYTVDDTTITATCKNTDNNCYSTNGGYVTIAAPSDLTYTGSKIEAVVDNQLTTGDTVEVTYTGNTTDGYPVNAGEYTASITLDGKEISVTYSIIAASIENATVTVNGTFTYDSFEKTPDIEVELNGDTLTKDTDYTVSYADNVNAGNATVTVKGLGNYEGTATKTFVINEKEIGFSWGGTQFIPYTGQLVLPEVSITGLEVGDSCEAIVAVAETTEGAGINPGEWTAKITGLSNGNYKLPEKSTVPVELTYTIYATQRAPTLVGVGESVNGKGDGHISGLTTEMEYATEQYGAYTRITDPDMTFAPGTYYVRYAAKDYYYSSPYAEVTISEGRKLTVTLPQNQVGYTVTASANELGYGEDVTITLTVHDGYSKTADFKFICNDVDRTAQLIDGKTYTLSDLTDDVTIKVEGIADITEPTATINLKDNWNKFWNDLSFGLFFNETQTFTIDAADVNTGSGINKIYYYLSDKELTKAEVEAITDWTEYNDAVNVDPDKVFVIYAKVTDNAGNITYVNSNGIVLDATAPAITGIENGETYYTTQKVTVTDKNIDSVTLNSGTAGTDITLDGNKEFTYTIIATDKAGNSTTVTVTMKPIKELAKATENLGSENVTSDDAPALKELVEKLDELIADPDTSEGGEKETLEQHKSIAEDLLKAIEDTKAEIARINEELNKYDATTVNSDDTVALEQLGKDIKALTDGGNLTDAEREALTENADSVAVMQKTVADTVAENDRIIDTVDNYDLATVTSDDKADLEQLLADIEKQLESTNLTEEEISELNGNKKAVEDLLTKIKGTDELIDKLTQDVDGYNDDTVKSTDKAAIEQIIEDIDALLETENLTEDEKKALEDTKEKAEGLLDTIEDVAEATDTENTEKVKDVTTENVTPEDKTDLEKAKADLEKALENNGSNMTEDEKKAIEDEIKRIDEAFTVIENVEAVEEVVSKLPAVDTVKPDDEEAIKVITDAQAAYNALSDYEKSLVDEDTKAALDKLVAALVAYDIVEGDGSSWTEDSDHNITFVVNGLFGKFVGIKVDGKDVDKANYEVKAGSTIITLKASYLDTLKVGEHTITVVYTDGSADGTFNVHANANSPATGDNSNMFLWIALLFISGGAVITLTVVDRKRRYTAKR